MHLSQLPQECDELDGFPVSLACGHATLSLNRWEQRKMVYGEVGESTRAAGS